MYQQDGRVIAFRQFRLMTIQPPRQRVTQLHEHEHQRFTANGKPSAADGKTLATTRQMGVVRVAASFIIPAQRSEEHTSELQSLMRTSYAVFCLKKKKTKNNKTKKSKLQERKKNNNKKQRKKELRAHKIRDRAI